jgi:hypothetical protein
MKGGPEPVVGSWVIKGLEQGQGYEVRVQAKNRYRYITLDQYIKSIISSTFALTIFQTWLVW